MVTVFDDLELAHALVGLGGELGLSYFRRGVAVRTKADGTTVTDADLAVERALRDHLGRARPHDAILGEEYGSTGRSNRTWLLDPIDGTSYFAAGDPHWRVQVALQVDGITVVSVVSAPALSLRWWATGGGGAFESTWSAEQRGPATRLRVSSTAKPDRGRIAAWPPDVKPLVPSSCAVVQASSLHLVDVVRATIDGFVVACCHAWDHAPWILLVEEAGGRFTDWAGGHDADRHGGVFSNAALHPMLTAALAIDAAD